MTEQQLMQMQQQMNQLQNMQAAGAGMGAGMMIAMAVIWIGVYLFCAYCIARLAVRLGMEFKSSFIWALIPIANIFLLLKLAAKPMWWFLLFLIPIVNLVAMILLWMSLVERLGKPAWWGVVIALVPIVNIVLFLMLVFESPRTQVAHA